MEYIPMITYNQLTFVQKMMVDDESYYHDPCHPYNYNEVVSQEYYDAWNRKFDKWLELKNYYKACKRAKQPESQECDFITTFPF